MSFETHPDVISGRASVEEMRRWEEAGVDESLLESPVILGKEALSGCLTADELDGPSIDNVQQKS